MKVRIASSSDIYNLTHPIRSSRNYYNLYPAIGGPIRSHYSFPNRTFYAANLSATSLLPILRNTAIAFNCESRGRVFPDSQFATD